MGERQALFGIVQGGMDLELRKESAERTIEIGMAHARAHRITYVGELGFELYVPTEFARHVLAVLLEAGASHGLRLAGMLAFALLLAGCDNCGDWVSPMGGSQACRQQAPRPQ